MGNKSAKGKKEIDSSSKFPQDQTNLNPSISSTDPAINKIRSNETCTLFGDCKICCENTLQTISLWPSYNLDPFLFPYYLDSFNYFYMFNYFNNVSPIVPFCSTACNLYSF